MCDDWMTGLRLPLTFEQFHQLPRNPAYKYEFFDGTACLSPRPKYYHAVLEFEPPPALEKADTEVLVRPLAETDWEKLAPVFTGAFRGLPPFNHLEDEPRAAAARKCLEHTRQGGDGPLIGPACFTASLPDD